MPSVSSSIHSALRGVAPLVQWAGVRHSRELTAHRVVRNCLPQTNASALDEGAMCEVLVDGHFGHAATADLSASGLQRAFERAVATTQATSARGAYRFEARHRRAAQGSFRSARVRDLDATGLAEITDCLVAATAAMQLSDLLVTRVAHAMLVQTQIDCYATNGMQTQQNFDLVSLQLAATAAQGSESQTRTWSRTGQFGGEVFAREEVVAQAARVAHDALDLLQAPNCPSGAMDLVLMPDQMMLQIHESIGHPLELDRILGDERNYAGWSFVKPEDFGHLRYGSHLMNVCFDPTREHQFASYAFDDGGHAARKEMLIEDGLLLRGLGSIESQERSGLPGVANFRSASWNRAPIDRMANINLVPGSSTLEELVGQVEHGILMASNRSWSIDDYRNKFQFGCEHGQLIENGRLGAVVRNPNYRGVTVDFWSRLAGVGRDDEAHGTPYCGKGEPSQVIRVGHASPPCLFRGIDVFGGQA